MGQVTMGRHTCRQSIMRGIYSGRHSQFLHQVSDADAWLHPFQRGRRVKIPGPCLFGSVCHP